MAQSGVREQKVNMGKRILAWHKGLVLKKALSNAITKHKSLEKNIRRKKTFFPPKKS